MNYVCGFSLQKTILQGPNIEWTVLNIINLFCLASINKFIDLLGSLGTDLAVWNDASSDEPAAPNDTPTASPSGIL